MLQSNFDLRWVHLVKVVWFRTFKTSWKYKGYEKRIREEIFPRFVIAAIHRQPFD